MKHLLGQCDTLDGGSVPLPEEHEEENITTGVYCGKMHLSGDVLGSRGEGSQQQYEAARPDLRVRAIRLLKCYCQMASCWWVRRAGVWEGSGGVRGVTLLCVLGTARGVLLLFCCSPARAVPQLWLLCDAISFY